MSEYGSVSVIIPAHNEAEGLADVLMKLKELATTHNWQVIVVDDGSTDGTAEIARGFGFKVVILPYNIGYGAALKAGIRSSNCDILVFMDGDGQHDPRNIRRLIRRIEPYDMVVGARRKGGAESWIRKPGKWLLSRVADFLADMKIPDVNSGFRAVRRTCAEEFTMLYPNGFSFSTTITLAMIKAGYSIKYVPIRIRPRRGRKSTVRQGRDGTKTILLILRCIVLFNPLKVFAPIAAFLFVFGASFTLYSIALYHKVSNSAIIILLSSLIIFFFGLIADQLSIMRKSLK